MKALVVSHAAMVEINQEPFDALADGGWEVEIVVPKRLRTDIRGSIEAKALPGSRARLHPLDVSLGGYRPWLGGQRGIHLIVYRGLGQAIERAQPDVIFVEEEPHSLAAYQVARAAVRLRIPFVVHENQNVYRRLPPPFGRLRTIVLGCAAGVTTRNAAAEALVRHEGFAGPVAPFPHGVDVARFDDRERRTALPPPVVGFVGRLVPEKGILDLVDALDGLGARLLVVGDGPLRERVAARARERGVPAELLGAIPHDQVAAWYGSMDVVAVPSRTTQTWKEQFGRIVIEANAARVPVVVSDSGELPATVAATGGGVVVPEGDVDALRAALRALLDDPERRMALGAAGRAGVEARFTPRAIGIALGRLLEKVKR